MELMNVWPSLLPPDDPLL